LGLNWLALAAIFITSFKNNFMNRMAMSATTIATNTPPMASAAGIHSGLTTHTHGQLITWASFSPMKRIVSSPKNPVLIFMLISKR